MRIRPSAFSLQPSAPLSELAIRLLTTLRGNAAIDARSALTDERLAGLIDCPERDVVDVAGELLAHGYPVIAGGSGRFLLPDEADSKPLRNYVHSLTRRCLEIFRRRNAAKRCLDARSARRQQTFVFRESA